MNFHKLNWSIDYEQSSHTLLWDMVMHIVVAIFVVNILAPRGISLKV